MAGMAVRVRTSIVCSCRRVVSFRSATRGVPLRMFLLYLLSVLSSARAREGLCPLFGRPRSRSGCCWPDSSPPSPVFFGRSGPGEGGQRGHHFLGGGSPSRKCLLARGVSSFVRLFRCRRWFSRGACPSGGGGSPQERVVVAFASAVPRPVLRPWCLLFRFQCRCSRSWRLVSAWSPWAAF